MNLVTEKEAGDFVGFAIQSGTKEASMITLVSNRIENYCGVPDFKSAERTEYHDGGNSFLFLKHWPIASIASIYDDEDHSWPSDTILDSSDYFISANLCGVVFSESGDFTKGVENIKVTYTAGYAEADVPQGLKTACLLQLAYEIIRVRSNRTEEAGLDLLPEVRAILRAYRRVCPVT